MIAVTSAAGVTSKAGFQTATSSGSPAARRTSEPARCSMSIAAPSAVAASSVERGTAT